MKLIRFITIVVTAACFSGCEALVKDLDEDEIPKVESKLVVSCYISPQSPDIRVVVSQSQPVLGTSGFYPSYILNANVVLSGSSGQVTLPPIDSLFYYAVDSSAFKIRPGETYTLSVSDGKRSVEATCTVPSGVPAIVSTDIGMRKVPGNPDSVFMVGASWRDIPGEKNYYSVRGHFTSELSGIFNFDPVSQQPILRRFRNKNEFGYYPVNSNIFSDANLDGSVFNAPKYQSNWGTVPDSVAYLDKNGAQKFYYTNPKIDEVHLEIMNLDEHYYQFPRSSANFEADNPFVEPTPVYTNVKGGLGVFGSFNAAVVVDKTGW